MPSNLALERTAGMNGFSQHEGPVSPRPLSARSLDSVSKLMDTVLEVVPYDTNWPRVFAAERDRIAAALDALALTTARLRSRVSPRSRSSTSKSRWSDFIQSRPTLHGLLSWDMSTCPIPTMRCVRSSIGQPHGRTRTMFM